MGLAIDGNAVRGIAKGGQPFLAMQANNDGTININGNVFTQIPKFNQKNGHYMQASQNSDGTYDLAAGLIQLNEMYGKKVIMFLMWQANYFTGYEMLVTQPFQFGTPSSNGFAVMDNIKPLIYSDTLKTSNIKLIYNVGKELTVSGLPAVGSDTGGDAYVSFGYDK